MTSNISVDLYPSVMEIEASLLNASTNLDSAYAKNRGLLLDYQTMIIWGVAISEQDSTWNWPAISGTDIRVPYFEDYTSRTRQI